MTNFTILTGACGGLGKAFSRELLKCGNNLIITGTNLGKTQKWAEELQKEYKNCKILAFELNLADEESIEKFVADLALSNVNITRLVNNAGLIVEGGLMELPQEKVYDAIRINCLGTIMLTRKLLETASLKEILTTASLAAFYPMPYMSIYASTKSFLEKFMVALRQELKPKGIKVSVLCPSGIPTTPAMIDAIKSQGLGGRITAKTPEYIAHYALNKLAKNKAVIIPGTVNRFTRFISRFASEKFLAKRVAKMWEKANKKRTIK